MRRIRMDAGGMQVVHAGAVWPFSEIEPNSREAVAKLERNESLVTWLQPVGGSVEQQVPTIKMADGSYYVLSLRCMKAVFKHMRLRKGFSNIERNCCGQLKLKIPMCLLREKIRTQSRFNGLRRAAGMPVVANTSTSSVNSIIEKITGFLDNTIMPLARELQHETLPPARAADFVASADDTMHNMLALVHSESPDLLRDKGCFMLRTDRAYDAFTSALFPAGGRADSAQKVVPHDDHEERTRCELADMEDARLL